MKDEFDNIREVNSQSDVIANGRTTVQPTGRRLKFKHKSKDKPF